MLSVGWVWPHCCLHLECWVSVTILLSSYWVLGECDHTVVFILNVGWVWPHCCLHLECWVSVTILLSSYWVLGECDHTAAFILSVGWVWPYCCLHLECWVSVTTLLPSSWVLDECTILLSSGPMIIIVVVWEERARAQFATLRKIVVIFTAIDGTCSIDEKFWQ